MSSEDQVLVEKAKKGDKRAFSLLIERYYGMIYSAAFGVLNNHEETKDALQDALLKAFEKLSTFEGKSKFSTWLHRIAINTALDHARRKSSPRFVSPQEGDETGEAILLGTVAAAPDPRREAYCVELKGFVEKALAELSPDHRAVLLLREWNGLSYEEIAETLGVEIGTVMSRIFYAKKKLAETLKRLHPQDDL